MKLVIRGRFAQPEWGVLGTLSFQKGKLVTTGEVPSDIAEWPAILPPSGRRVTVADGDLWLQALVYEFRDYYRAELTTDDV